MRKIKIFDTTLRDGEQSPGCSMSIEEKIEVAKQLEKLNVDVIEAGFAASSLNDKIAIEEICKTLNKPIITSLARCVKQDIDVAYESLKYAKNKRIHTFIATSDIHMKYKLNMTREQVLKRVEQIVSYAKSLVEDIEFSCEDATRSNPEFLCEVIECAIKNGANVINVPDTVGYMMPLEYSALIKYIKSNVKGIDSVELSCHCHNDLGLAVANSMSGIIEGINQVECTINGIGERAGNASLEEIVAIINTRKDYFNVKTDINLKEIYNSSRLICDITKNNVQNNKPIVGANAFKHEAGIHQHGVLKAKETYEIMNSEDYGIYSEHIIIGIHSGKHAVIAKIEELNYDAEKYDIEKLLVDIKEYIKDNNEFNDDIFVSLLNKNLKRQKVMKI